MHFRGHSRRNAPLLPPFVVYYGHRAGLCLICHSRNSYRAENRPVTANRAVFCFMRARAVRRVVSAHLRGDSCPKTSKAGKKWYTKHRHRTPELIGAKGIITPHQACDQITGHPRLGPVEKAGTGEITIAISRSILSNKRSKAVRRMPDGLAAFGGTNPLSHRCKCRLPLRPHP